MEIGIFGHVPTLRGEIKKSKNEEDLLNIIMDYHSSKGSVMDFTEDDWQVCKAVCFTLDEVCRLCGETRFCEDVDNLESYFQAVHNDDSEAGVEAEFLELSQRDAIALLADFYTWREHLLPKVRKIYANG